MLVAVFVFPWEWGWGRQRRKKKTESIVVLFYISGLTSFQLSSAFFHWICNPVERMIILPGIRSTRAVWGRLTTTLEPRRDRDGQSAGRRRRRRGEITERDDDDVYLPKDYLQPWKRRRREKSHVCITLVLSEHVHSGCLLASCQRRENSLEKLSKSEFQPEESSFFGHSFNICPYFPN